MCGIFGLVGSEIERSLDAGTDALVHRGPDGRGVWLSPDKKVGLGHRRLSILDLSTNGRQPMVCKNQDWVLTYNGEIYNFQSLRPLLQDVHLRSNSDTEVLLELISQRGVKATLAELNGMFAFAAYNIRDRKLFLARDRMGEKPLYYGLAGNRFAFASELKAICKVEGFAKKINHDAMVEFLRYGYVPSPHSIYEGVHKLPAASFLEIEIDGQGKFSVGDALCYWDLGSIARQKIEERTHLSDEDAITLLDEKLRKSVTSRMVSDVPLGAFLSGGYDSSAIVALMQDSCSSAINTFSIGIKDKREYDESIYARAVADHLGTNHTEHSISEEDALAIVPELANIYCEPFADPSQIPTILVSEIARQDVTVALSGDGGDELFAGYNRHFWAPSIWKRVSWLPTVFRKSLGYMLGRASQRTWDTWLSRLGVSSNQGGEKVLKVARALNASNRLEMYKNLCSLQHDPYSMLLKHGPNGHNGNQIPSVLSPPEGLAFIDSMLFLDSVTYLPGDILHKVDRASMSVSLESRIPMLDHDLVSFSWQIPNHLKVRNGEGKWILKQLVHRYIPKKMMDRPKMGFRIPICTWLRGPLKGWAETLIDRNRLDEQGIFNADCIHRIWSRHQSGKENQEWALWPLLILLEWMKRNF